MAQYTIDAKGRKLGRLATEVADLLRGKNDVSYAPHKLSENIVRIENASALDMDPRKMSEIYHSYSGYPGGLREENREHMIERFGYAEVVRRAVRGMLPNNRLRSRMLKNLIVIE